MDEGRGRTGTVLRSMVLALEMIKIEHTLFAAPFCLAALLVASDGRPGLRTLALVLVALTAARAAAMTFNRIVDVRFDAANPRTRNRHLVIGSISRGAALTLWLTSAAVFVISAWAINPLAGTLSPVALLVVLGYSYTKRYTDLSHFILGLALGLAPLGAWIAAHGELDTPPLALAAAVLCWVAGFDIIYACQDAGFDRSAGLRSVPARLGIGGALAMARALHVGALACLALFGLMADMGAAYFMGIALTGILLAYEHRLVRPSDLSRVNAAFFTVNGVISLLVLAATAVDVYTR